MKAAPHRCPECGLFYFSRELALYALYAGCPGCGQGLYGGPVAQASRLRSIYRCADGTEIPLWHRRPACEPAGPEPVSAILVRLWDEATGLQP